MRHAATTGVLFVCLGNICRSPTAEGVFRHVATEAGLVQALTIDSAGTGGWHAGASPDARMIRAARQRGFVLGGAARQVRLADFSDFDYILAMDSHNLRDLTRLAPTGFKGHLGLFRDFDPMGSGDVPDPYYGGDEGFLEVVDMVERTCRVLLSALEQSLPG